VKYRVTRAIVTPLIVLLEGVMNLPGGITSARSPSVGGQELTGRRRQPAVGELVHRVDALIPLPGGKPCACRAGQCLGASLTADGDGACLPTTTIRRAPVSRHGFHVLKTPVSFIGLSSSRRITVFLEANIEA
jgi:hypothetical protein